MSSQPQQENNSGSNNTSTTEQVDRQMETVDMDKNMREWTSASNEMCRSMEKQIKDLKIIHNKVMAMRQEVAEATLHSLRTSYVLKSTKQLIESIKEENKRRASPRESMN